MHYMVCISGFSGAGKDECANQLTKHHYAVQTGLADPGKRHMADAYGFTEQQLYGPSHFRNAGDVRVPKNSFYERCLRELPRQVFPSGIEAGSDEKYKIDGSKVYWIYTGALDPKRPHWKCGEEASSWMNFVQEGDPEFWLSPREALQQYMEKMNQLDVYTWIRKGIENQLQLATKGYAYERMEGLIPVEEAWARAKYGEDGKLLHPPGLIQEGSNIVTCFADFRHIPEIQYTKEFEARSLVPFHPILIRVKRPSILVPPYNHRSETEQVKIRDAAFDAIVHNDKDIPHLHTQIDEVLRRAMAGDIPSNPWREEYVIPDRKPEEGYAP